MSEERENEKGKEKPQTLRLEQTREYVQFSMRKLEKDLHRRLKILAVESDSTLEEIAGKVIEAGLGVVETEVGMRVRNGEVGHF